MHNAVRRTLAVTVGTGAILIAAAGVANAADDSGNSHHPNGQGSGLSGGPTPTYVLNGAPAVPLNDPTLGEGTALPPVYNTLGSTTG